MKRWWFVTAVVVLSILVASIPSALLVQGSVAATAAAVTPAREEAFYPDKPLTHFAFGSCNKDDRPQPLWKPILDYQPDLWLWLGDIIYSDRPFWPLLLWRPGSEHSVKAQYQRQKDQPDYAKLRNTTSILGIWDDHDFGINNGGKEFERRRESQRWLLEFLDERPDSPRWHREGLYASYTFGPKGKRAKLILLDTRYFRDPPPLPHEYEEGLDHSSGESQKDMLGEEQWRWLEREVIYPEEEEEEAPQVLILASGVQVLPVDKTATESWGNYPTSRRRLLRLLRARSTTAKRGGAILLLSGDVHYAEMFRTRFPSSFATKNENEGEDQYTASLLPQIYEVTSSGMTHCCATQIPFGMCRRLLEGASRSEWQISDFYEHRNWGAVEIDWESVPPVVRMQVRTEHGTVALEHVIPFGEAEGEEAESRRRALVKAEEEEEEGEREVPAWRRWHQDIWLDYIRWGLIALFLAIATAACWVLWKLFGVVRRTKKVALTSTKKKVQ
ncbi:Alkaline phosphatase [Balamuthia mandrillaris]